MLCHLNFSECHGAAAVRFLKALIVDNVQGYLNGSSE